MLPVFKLLARLPLPLLHVLGALGGWLVYALSPAYRRRLRENLQVAGLDKRATRRAAIAAAGRQALEMAWVWLRPPRDLLRATTVDDAPGFMAFLGQPRPVLMLTPHLGCFEVIAQYYMLQPQAAAKPMTALYRVPRKAALRPLLEHARARHGLRLAPADLRGVRLMLRALKERQIVGMLPDQVPSRGDGVWAPFFGRPAYTMTLPARLVAASGAAVAVYYAERLPRGRGFRIRWRAIDVALGGEPALAAAALNRVLEDLVRELPGQYLWGYNRYKVPHGVAPATSREAASSPA
jgi:Kdo2-lipid IVA lauroyltransferase/acyltransferase